MDALQPFCNPDAADSMGFDGPPRCSGVF
jgi:hypothetical protein